MVRKLGTVVVAGALACAGPGPERGAVGVSPAPQAEAGQRASAARAVPGVPREEAAVRVGATPEHWLLEWRRPPRPVCAPDDPGAATCPCDGFAYGETGELDLVRRRPGRPDERLALTPLFADGENPAWQTHLAVLQRWPVLEPDYAAIDSVDLGPAVRARPAARAMALGDYDHDGRATEFLLQVGASPCGHRASVLVGVSSANPSLHAFTSVAHPEQPLVLDPEIWELLRQSGGDTTGVEWRCADHGSETQTEVRLSAGPAGIDGTRSEYQCAAGRAKGRLIRSERL